jgi:uncharacterized protein YmfQ (DUF2313 family)
MTILNGIIGTGHIASFVIGGYGYSTLAEFFPNGENRWVSLFTTIPDAGGVGGVESIVDRQAVSSWTYDEQGNRVCRQRVTFDPPGTEEEIQGYGIWDAETGGNLLAFGPAQVYPGGFTWMPLRAWDFIKILQGELVLSWDQELTLLDVSDERYKTPLVQLLPNGLAWAYRAAGIFDKLYRALSYPFSRVSRRAQDLLRERDPRTSYELLPDWERVLGLPGDCNADPPTTISGRRASAYAKLVQADFSSQTFFGQLGDNLGYVHLEYRDNNRPFRCGVSACGDPLQGHHGGWAWSWTIFTHGPNENDGTLDCLVEDTTQAHAYSSVDHTDFSMEFHPDLETLEDALTGFTGTADGTVWDNVLKARDLDGVTDRLDWPGIEVAGSAFTLLFWTYLHSFPSTMRAWNTRWASGSGSSFFGITAAGRLWMFRATDGSSMQRQTNNAQIDSGRWHHVSVSCRANLTASQVNMTIDGELITSYAVTTDGTGTERSTAFGWHLGGRFINDSDNLHGRLADFRMCRTVVPLADIRTLMGLWRPPE